MLDCKRKKKTLIRDRDNKNCKKIYDVLNTTHNHQKNITQTRTYYKTKIEKVIPINAQIN
jgi:hypothetical protein